MTIEEKVTSIFEKCGIDMNSYDEKSGTYDNFDSVAFITIVVEVEQEFNIEIPDDQLTMINFSNPSLIVDYIQKNT